MRWLRLFLVAILLLGVLAPGPCQREESVTAEEATEALDEATLSTQALALTSSSIEFSTSFTIGQAVEEAAEELRAFITSQLPCAEVTLVGATLTADYGALPGTCTYRGLTFHGRHTITLTSVAAAGVVVDHAWEAFTNGLVSVTGSAHVTWSQAGGLQRRVEHVLTWTRVADGREGTGSGDRTQTLLEGGLVEGIQVDGVRDWTSQTGAWHLDIQAVQMRWDDPIPQSGAYVMIAASGRSLTMSFARVDDDTIAVTLRSGSIDFTFQVNKLGQVSS